MTTQKTTLGNDGEALAANYLKEHGFRIVATNYQNSSGRRLGEVDIIAEKNKELIFVEVKTRKSRSTETRPEEVIGYQKIKRLAKIAEQYIRAKGRWNAPYRFDAITVVIHPETNKVDIRHLDHIFL